MTSTALDEQLLDVSGAKVRAGTVFPPSQIRSFGAGVVMAHGAFGVDAGVERLARRLALAGYNVIVPDLFHGCSASDPTERIRELSWSGVRDDLSACMAHLRIERNAERFAVVGFCMGGAIAWMAAAELDIAAAVAFYPHDMFAPFGSSGPIPASVTSPDGAPMVAHFGADDTNPSLADMQRLDEVLQSTGIVHSFYSYRGAGHGFAGANPERVRPVAANTAIDRTVGWLDRFLRNA